MKLTPLDIRQKTFEKSYTRGVDKDEVQAFLTAVSQEWERQSDENRELRSKLDQALQDVQKMREVESSLYRTLKTAEDTGAAIAAQAQQEADAQVREAKSQAENAVNEAQSKARQMVSEAKQQAQRIVDEAYQTAQKTVADMKQEVSGLGTDCQRLEQQYEALVRDLHKLATDGVERAEKARARPKGDVAAILSRAASVEVERPKAPAAETPEPMIATAAPSRSTSAAISTSLAAIVPKPESVSHPAAPVEMNPAPATPLKTSNEQPEPKHEASQFTNYNPKPGQQPDPGTPAQTPGPEIERPGAPAENPGISPAPNIEQPAPSQVPDPTGPRVEPVAPDIQPIGPNHPEIAQPVPVTHPGQPGMVAGAVGEKPTPTETATAAAGGEKSFFDEI